MKGLQDYLVIIIRAVETLKQQKSSVSNGVNVEDAYVSEIYDIKNFEVRDNTLFTISLTLVDGICSFKRTVTFSVLDLKLSKLDLKCQLILQLQLKI